MPWHLGINANRFFKLRDRLGQAVQVIQDRPIVKVVERVIRIQAQGGLIVGQGLRIRLASKSI